VNVEPVRWGILSTADINRAVIPPLQESPASEVVAVASRTPARADAYATEWGIPRAYGTYEGLLGDPDVEAVYISTPNGLHVDGAIASLEAGKHVLVEKPFSRSAAEVERAFAAADRAGRLLMEAFMYRHHPQTHELTTMLHAGAIGELRLVRTSFSFTIDEGNVRLSTELEGGALMDVGCYCVSGSRLLAGEPVLAVARQVLGPTGIDMRLAGTLVFAGDVVAQLDCAFDLPLRQGLEAVGSEGTLAVATPWGCSPAGIELRRDDEQTRIAFEDVDRYRLQGDNFSRAIRGLEPPLLGRDDALGQARAIAALYRSAESGGEPVAVETAS
jgi:D-xylose 1-dehydrogenase (NADP+, D-xylono-1,5-lactone-forming)